MRVAVLASGRGSNLDSLLAACGSGLVDAQVTLVLSDKRGAPCLEKAQAAGVPACVELPPEEGEGRSAFDARLLEVLGKEAPDLVVLAGFMRILTGDVIDAFPQRIVNIHPALLPSFKGANGIRDTLAAGAPLAGCTTHVVTTDLDGGPMVLQAALAVHPDDDDASLAARVLEMEHRILPRTVQLFAEGRIQVEGGRVRIAPGDSWHERHPVPAGTLFSEGY